MPAGRTLIFLVGYMGCGKTTIGYLLRQRLGLPFLDMDACLEQREGMTCTELMLHKGADYFRQAEHDLLRELVAYTMPAIIATGGGTPCYHGNMQLINDAGSSFFIDFSVENLAIRLELDDLSNRPVLQGRCGQALRDFIREQLPQRMPYYKQAHYCLDCNDLTDDAIADQIANKVLPLISIKADRK